MSFCSIVRDVRDGFRSLSRRSFEVRIHGLYRGKSHGAVHEIHDQEPVAQHSCWANLPPELLRDVIKRLEASENTWPSRKHVVACASVCRAWREVCKEIVRSPELCGKLTFLVSLKQAFVSEYEVHGSDAGSGSLLAALAEASFLIGLERNSDVVEMASYAPLFVNSNDRGFNPDAIVFNSWQTYGTPSYWMQHFFKDSGGATIYPANLQASPSTSLIASAITWLSPESNSTYLKIKVVNFGSDIINLKISVSGLEKELTACGSIMTVLNSNNVMDENSFSTPNKVVPVRSKLANVEPDMNAVLSPHSLTSFDLLVAPTATSYRSSF